MNILHLKYAVEISKTHSISKAAEEMYMGQPNLSRAIKELEEELGIVIFNRTSKGITVTLEGEEFLHYAKRIISQIDEVERIYKKGKEHNHRFSVCAPRASYISYALTEFAKNARDIAPAEIFYKETNSLKAINNVLNDQYNLAILRYAEEFEKYFENLFTDKNLHSETLTEFSFILIFAKNHPLVQKSEIWIDDLAEYTQITHADKYVPSLPQSDIKKAELSDIAAQHIYIFERGSQFELLEKVSGSFMWVSPVPQELCKKYNLVQRKCSDSKRIHKDVLVYQKKYKPTALDVAFISAVKAAGKQYL